MNNWKEFFNKYLIQTGLYRIQESTRIGDTDMEIFSNKNASNETCIKTGYLQNGELILYEIIHPDTVGFNKYQEQEYFYRFDFTPGESYGPPGLEFNENNRKAIYDLLKNGLKGKEEQFYQEDKLIKSVVYQSYGEGESTEYGITIWFEKKSLTRRLMSMFAKSKPVLEKKIIDLKSIFQGIDI